MFAAVNRQLRRLGLPDLRVGDELIVSVARTGDADMFRGPRRRGPRMGEEKPDEELMGKRKPCPRFSQRFRVAVISMPVFRPDIRPGEIFFSFSTPPVCDTITLTSASGGKREIMRVISGSARGIRLRSAPGTNIRPTADRVKESLFNVIGPYFVGGRALDLFAGTGSLGIEALSRGVDRCVFVDCDPRSVDVIRQNLRAAKLESRAEVYRNDAFRAVRTLAGRGAAFDLVFLDPPYRLKLIAPVLAELEKGRLLSPGATVVAEHAAADATPAEVGSLAAVRRLQYGDTALTIYVRLAENVRTVGEVGSGGTQSDGPEGATKR